MRFTVVVEVDPEGYPEGDLTELVKSHIENDIGKVYSIGIGDESNVGWHYVTRWHYDDFEQMLVDRGVYPSEENVSTLMYACRHMEDAQVESGWNHMDYVAGDCSFEPEFKCEHCGEEIMEEDNGLCDFCREEMEEEE